MITLNIRLDELIDDLLKILDEDAEHIKLTLGRLNRLRASVIKRDQEDIKALLDTVREDDTGYSQTEITRHTIRKELAQIVGCSVGEMNLTRLRRCLSEEKAMMVAEKQRELKVLIEKLRIEHTCTSMLIKECTRLNKMLLRSIFSNGRESVTYNARGDASWEMRKGIVNFKL